MKIIIEEKVKQEIEVSLPMYRRGLDGWFYYFIDEKTVIHLWTTAGNYRVALQSFRSDMITETQECSKKEFEQAFNEVVENIKTML